MKRFSLRELNAHAKMQGISMRRRFFLYILSILFSVIAVLILLLNIFGVIRPADTEIERALAQQLDTSADHIESEMEHLAALAAVFSDELGSCISSQDVSFDELKDNSDALLALQEDAYNTVYNYMRRAECSGAFYILNTTVNDSLDKTYHDGIYLKYANLSSETTVRNSVRMFRGNVQVARQNGINLHSSWEYETLIGTFPQLEDMLNMATAKPGKDYILTAVYKLPGTWEQVRLLCTPICDDSGKVIGVCGFEISSLLFEFAYTTSAANQSLAVCALLSEDGRGYTAQISGNRSGYTPDLYGALALGEKDQFITVSDDRGTFIGLMKPLGIGMSSHNVAVLLPQGTYQSYVSKMQNETVLLLLAVATLAICISLWLSRRYVSPILHSIERVKSRQYDSSDTHIPEIDDLFAYLAEQDRCNEETLTAIRRENDDSQASLDSLRQEHGKLQERLKQLSQSKRDEVYPDEYAYFVEGIKKLSSKERAVFDYYIQGKSVKEIAELLDISEDGVRYHNKNIYATLGVKGLKQLRMFISIMSQKDER